MPEKTEGLGFRVFRVHDSWFTMTMPKLILQVQCFGIIGLLQGEYATVENAVGKAWRINIKLPGYSGLYMEGSHT